MNTWQPGMTLEQIEKQAIQSAFRFYNGNKTQTANSLGIAIRTLDSKLEKYEQEASDGDKRRKEADARDQEFQRRSRGDVDKINAAANRSQGSDNGDGSKAGVRVQSPEKAPSQHAMPMHEREKVQEVSSRSSAFSRSQKTR